VKTLFLLLVIYLAYVVLKGYVFRKSVNAARRGGGYSVGSEPPPSERAHHEEPDTSEVTVEDPVCGSFVPVSAAEPLKIPSGVVYFCSAECRDKFIETRGE
jgi:YHS domain-containing protein